MVKIILIVVATAVPAFGAGIWTAPVYHRKPRNVSQHHGLAASFLDALHERAERRNGSATRFSEVGKI